MTSRGARTINASNPTPMSPTMIRSSPRFVDSGTDAGAGGGGGRARAGAGVVTTGATCGTLRGRLRAWLLDAPLCDDHPRLRLRARLPQQERPRLARGIEHVSVAVDDPVLRDELRVRRILARQPLVQFGAVERAERVRHRIGPQLVQRAERRIGLRAIERVERREVVRARGALEGRRGRHELGLDGETDELLRVGGCTEDSNREESSYTQTTSLFENRESLA